MRLLDGAGCVAFLLLALSPGCAAGRDTGLKEARDRIRELEAQNSELRAEVDALEARLRGIVQFADDFSFSEDPSYPPIDATLLDRKLEGVVLDKGKRDSVEVGYVFDVYRGTTYKGRVKVNEVQELTCSCVIVNEINAMASGDSATTRL